MISSPDFGLPAMIQYLNKTDSNNKKSHFYNKHIRIRKRRNNLQQEKGTPHASLDPTDADEQLKYMFLSQSWGPSIPQHSS